MKLRLFCACNLVGGVETMSLCVQKKDGVLSGLI